MTDVVDIREARIKRLLRACAEQHIRMCGLTADLERCLGDTEELLRHLSQKALMDREWDRLFGSDAMYEVLDKIDQQMEAEGF